MFCYMLIMAAYVFVGVEEPRVYGGATVRGVVVVVVVPGAATGEGATPAPLQRKHTSSSVLAVAVGLHGTEAVRWVPLVTTAPQDDVAAGGAVAVLAEGAEGVAASRTTLWDAHDGDALPAGTHTFPFALRVPPWAPGSYAEPPAPPGWQLPMASAAAVVPVWVDPSSRCAYSVVATTYGAAPPGLVATRVRLQSHTTPLTVLERIPPTVASAHTPVVGTGAKTFLLGGGRGPLTLTVTVPRAGWWADAPVPVHVSLQNASTKTVEALRVRIRATAVYRADGHELERTLAEATERHPGLGVGPLGDAQWQIHSPAVASMMASRTLGEHIHVRHTLTVEACVTSALNLAVTLPLYFVARDADAGWDGGRGPPGPTLDDLALAPPPLPVRPLDADSGTKELPLPPTPTGRPLPAPPPPPPDAPADGFDPVQLVAAADQFTLEED
jgi:hypothetical protein